MTCRDFERIWNEVLDARGDGRPEAEGALELHATACPACRAAGERYQLLRQAIRALGPPPAPSADFAARCLEAWGRRASDPAPRTILRFPTAARWAAAAAALLVAGLGVRAWLLPKDREGPPPLARQEPPRPRPLAESLAEATAATLDLAWETSAPAARVGREVLGDVAVPAASTAMVLPVPVETTTQAWQEVGDRVNYGVRPLSGTARSAFGFLLAPAFGVEDEAPQVETGSRTRPARRS